MIPLIGYSDKLSARAGEAIAFKVSCVHDKPYTAELVRIICADPNPRGPGMREEAIAADINGEYPSRVQPFYAGSLARVATPNLFDKAKSFTLAATLWATLPDHGEQGILCCVNAESGSGISLFIDDHGACGTTFGDAKISTGAKLTARKWYRVWTSFDAANQTLTVAQIALHEPNEAITKRIKVNQPSSLAKINETLIAALNDEQSRAHFNGKIESPFILNRALNATEFHSDATQIPDRIAHWDFARDIPTTRIIDIAKNAFHGALINHPTRAMTGEKWDGSEMCWRHQPAHYAAIHFHADDLYDFGWDTDFRFTIPEDLRCGMYAVRLQCGADYDLIPFFVCPPKDAPRAKFCVLVSTFTYAVYGNHARPNFAPQWLSRIKEWNAYPHNPATHREYGLSTYNDHADGSGICHASHRRPLLNLRPGYLTFGDSEGACSGLRHLQADSHLLAWLEANDIKYDLVTDRELHDEGVAVIADYAAVATGSHPEYHTAETLDALQNYRAQGGNFLYLGGNGFYWRIALHDEDDSVIEIRRAESGIRAWAAEVGEYYQAFDGAYGGLWRRNNRPPQQLAGVGFSAQGNFYGRGYRRRPETFTDPEIAWIFAGIDDEVIGDFGYSGNGAAGFELDRADPKLGSPADLRILASSEGHDDSFVLVPEEQLTHLVTLPGDKVDDLIRADMVYGTNENGGQLFAVGSITFCGSLLYNNGDNNISKLLLNVINRFVN